MKWQNENATDEDIIKALKIAQAYEFVSKLNKGLDSFVEQGGKNFSGGQASATLHCQSTHRLTEASHS